MVRLVVTFGLIISLSAFAVGQSHREALATVQEIKLLESTRVDVRRLLANYITSEDNEHEQDYYNEDVHITVYFSDGTCTEDPDDDDPLMIWNATEWTVTRIEIRLKDEAAEKDIALDLSKLSSEQMYRDSPDHFIRHDKARGLAVETIEDGVERVILFPSASRANRLCDGSEVARDFYTRKSWFTKKLQNRLVCDWVNQHANVEDMSLSATEVEATTGKTISVTTVAKDPENDVLTYNYTVTGGTIVGTGAKVVWDLSRVRPGIYSILVGVDDGMGIVGKTVTKTVTVK